MKILIISLPRTGSTSLLTSISKNRNLIPLFEPFDGSNRYLYSDDMENIVLKTIVSEHYPENVEDYHTWIIEFSKKFDEVILLNRRDLKACAQSHAYSVYNKKRGFTSLDPYLWENTPIDELCYSNIVRWNEEINKISIELGIPITYYEDIYDLNSEDRLRKGDRVNTKKTII